LREQKYPEYFPESESTVDLWKRSILLIWSRSFDASAVDPNDTVHDPERRTWVMIPYGDLVNHETHLESFFGNEKPLERTGDEEKLDSDVEITVLPLMATVNEPWRLWATECVEAGQEVHQSYGSHKSTPQFLYNYGFIPPDYVSSDLVVFSSPTSDIGFGGIDVRFHHVSHFYSRVAATSYPPL
jgi:hypothetical protein